MHLNQEHPVQLHGWQCVSAWSCVSTARYTAVRMLDKWPCI